MNNYIVARDAEKVLRIGQIMSTAPGKIIGIEIATDMTPEISAAACDQNTLAQDFSHKVITG